MLVTIRCRNWEAEPEICHLDCGIDVTEEEANSTAWVSIVLATSPEWFVVLRTCPEHGRHMDPYCSLGCFTRHHQRHPHGA
jgi:hypothetical protein